MKNILLKKVLKKIGHDELLLIAVLLLLVLAHFFLGGMVEAQASWYNASWGYRQKITIDSANINSNLSDFPVLVHSSRSSWRSSANDGHVGQADGGDILFTADDGTTKLSHEFEKYDPLTGEIVAWVKLPTISASADTVLYLYYGNATSSDQWDTNGSTWNASYTMVQHFNENCSSSNCLRDSTANDIHGTPYSEFSATSDLSTESGKINGAMIFDGDNDQIIFDDVSALDLTDYFSIEAWVKPSDLSRYNSILSKGSYSVKIGPDDRVIFSGRVDDGFVSWSTSENLGGSMDQVKSFAIFDGYIYASGDNTNEVYRSIGGLNWTPVADFEGSRGVVLAVFDDNLYAAVSDLAEVWSSPDGETWIEVADLNDPDGGDNPSDGVDAESSDLLSMAVFDGYLYVGGSVGTPSELEGGEIFRTADGTRWYEVADFNEPADANEPSDGINDPYVTRVLSLTVHDGYLYAGVFRSGLGGPTRIYRSPNGLAWEQVKEWSSPDLSQVNSMGVYDDRLYAAVTLASASDNEIYYSVNGTSWTSSNFNLTTGLADPVVFSLVTYYGELYAGTGSNEGKMWTASSGAFPWEEEDDPGTVSDVKVLAHAPFKGRFFEGTGDQGKIFERSDIGFDAYSETELDSETWVHLLLSYDKDAVSDNVKIYVNGVLDAQADSTESLDTNSFDLLLGSSMGSTIGGDFASGEENFTGVIDELRISSGVRDADWASASYLNQSAPSSFYSFDLEEDQNGYFLSSTASPLVEGSIGSGVLTLTRNGGLAGGLEFPLSGPPLVDTSVTWTWSESSDYLSFHDSTDIDGFRLNIYMSSSDGGNFVYSGSSLTQENIHVSNLKVWPGFDGESYVSPSKGVDSATASLNIDSVASCEEAENLDNYTFNDSFMSSATEYGLEMSSTAQVYFASSAPCITEGTVDVRRFRMTYPGGSVAGGYISNLFLVVVDGQ